MIDVAAVLGIKKKDKSQKERMPLHNSKCTLLSETPWGRGTCTVCLEIEFFIINNFCE